MSGINDSTTTPPIVGDTGFTSNGYYRQNSTLDDVVVNVFRSQGDFITGGGHLVNSDSAGKFAAEDGLKTNFGFNIKYNPSFTSLKGKMTIIFRSFIDNTGTPGTTLHVYQIRTNALNSLGVPPDGDPNTATANFSAKANLTDVTNPLAPIGLGGNLDLLVTMTDNGEPGSSDTIAISLYNSSGQLLFASNLSGGAIVEQLLDGGNLVIHDADTLEVSGGATEAGNVPALTVEALQPALARALAFWRAQGADVNSLTNIDVRIADLVGPYLGLAYSSGLILIDPTAAGQGWDRIDLFSVVTHEVGHILGLEHGDAEGVMSPTLQVGAHLRPSAPARLDTLLPDHPSSETRSFVSPSPAALRSSLNALEVGMVGHPSRSLNGNTLTGTAPLTTAMHAQGLPFVEPAIAADTAAGRFGAFARATSAADSRRQSEQRIETHWMGQANGLPSVIPLPLAVIDEAFAEALPAAAPETADEVPEPSADSEAAPATASLPWLSVGSVVAATMLWEALRVSRPQRQIPAQEGPAGRRSHQHQPSLAR